MPRKYLGKSRRKPSYSELVKLAAALKKEVIRVQKLNVKIIKNSVSQKDLTAELAKQPSLTEIISAAHHPKH